MEVERASSSFSFFLSLIPLLNTDRLGFLGELWFFGGMGCVAFLFRNSHQKSLVEVPCGAASSCVCPVS